MVDRSKHDSSYPLVVMRWFSSSKPPQHHAQRLFSRGAPLAHTRTTNSYTCTSEYNRSCTLHVRIHDTTTVQCLRKPNSGLVWSVKIVPNPPKNNFCTESGRERCKMRPSNQTRVGLGLVGKWNRLSLVASTRVFPVVIYRIRT